MDHSNKLAPIAEGSYKVTKVVDNHKVVFKKTDRAVEKVSRTRVVLAPKPQSKKS